MAYTRNWSSTILLGSSQAKTIDDKFTELQVNVQERLESLLKAGTDIDDDPLTLPDEITGLVTGRKLTFGLGTLVGSAITPGNAYATIDSGGFTATAYAYLTIPIGYVITLAEAWIGAGTGSTITFQLQHINPLTAAETAVMASAVSTSTNSVVLKASSALTHTVVDDVLYRVKLVQSGGIGRIAGFRLTINRIADNRLGY